METQTWKMSYDMKVMLHPLLEYYSLVSRGCRAKFECESRFESPRHLGDVTEISIISLPAVG